MIRLFKICFSAFWNTKNVIRSLIGYNVRDNLHNNSQSEIHTSHWSLKEYIVYLCNVFIPSLPIYCPNWVPNFLKRSLFNGNSEFIQDQEYNEKNKNCFIYINGIITNKNALQIQRNCLKSLLKCPINGIHNNTDSFIMDLIECAIGKSSNYLTESSYLATSIVIKKILDPSIEKVIIIAHSQGTIIVSQVIMSLKNFGIIQEEFIKKLEIYCFANCSTKMSYITGHYPYMEHFANEEDIVAKLGCNCHPEVSHLINIDGIKFIKKGKYGHLFTSHYINNFKEDYPLSRLNTYIKSPDKI